MVKLIPASSGFQPPKGAKSILELVEQVKPPRLTSPELDALNIHTAGILAVKEALKAKPVSGVEYRELSRYATYVAVKRMGAHPAVVSLRNDRDAYAQQQKRLPQSLRKLWSDGLRVCSLYRPFVSCSNIHLWYWDEEAKQEETRIREDAGLSLSALYVFVAGALSELPNLDSIGDDLKQEYERGVQYLGLIANSLNYVQKQVGDYFT